MTIPNQRIGYPVKYATILLISSLLGCAVEAGEGSSDGGHDDSLTDTVQQPLSQSLSCTAGSSPRYENTYSQLSGVSMSGWLSGQTRYASSGTRRDYGSDIFNNPPCNALFLKVESASGYPMAGYSKVRVRVTYNDIVEDTDEQACATFALRSTYKAKLPNLLLNGPFQPYEKRGEWVAYLNKCVIRPLEYTVNIGTLPISYFRVFAHAIWDPWGDEFRRAVAIEVTPFN